METSSDKQGAERAEGKPVWWKSWTAIIAVVVLVVLIIAYFFHAKPTIFVNKFSGDEKEVSSLIKEVNRYFADN
jgi:hypothetical protein